MNAKVGDWVIFDMEVGQFKEERDGFATFSTRFVQTSGHLTDRFRPLTLRNKNIAETFKAHYEMLRQIDGEAGFNYPDIHRYFANLALEAIDGGDNGQMFDKARDFVKAARDYKPFIDGVRLFRRKIA